MSEDESVDLRKMNINLANPNDALAKIIELEQKLKAMRYVLWEWNCSSGPVWEYYRLMQAGEREEDYNFIDEDPDAVSEYDPPEHE